MPKPAVSEDDMLISQRIKWWRVERKLSQAVVADRAAITQPYLSHIEAGRARVDSRSTLERIAQALGVSYSDLTGQPIRPDTPALQAAHAAVERIRLAHVALDHDLPQLATLSPVEALRDEVGSAAQSWQDCEYAQAGRDLGRVITELAAHLAGPQHRDALPLFVQALDVAAWTVRMFGHYDLAYALTSRESEAAAQSADPALIGLAAFTRALMISAAASGDATVRATGYRVAQRAIDTLGPVATATEHLEVLGMLHLAAGRTGTDGNGHLGEARELARRTGEGAALHLYFGPTNVGIWAVHFAVESGQGGRVRELAQGVTLDAIPSTARRSMFWRHYGLGLAQDGPRHQADAVKALLRAERTAPGKLRLDPLARDAVGHMLSAARATAGGDDLRKLARHLGVL